MRILDVKIFIQQKINENEYASLNDLEAQDLLILIKLLSLVERLVLRKQVSLRQA